MDHNTSSSATLSEAERFSEPMAEALASLGASSGLLSPQERQQLGEQGFLVLEGMMPPPLLEDFRRVHEHLMARKYPDAPLPAAATLSTDHWHHEAGTRRLADLVSDDPIYDQTYTHPRLLAAVAQVFTGDFKLHSLNARDALPGSGIQPFHRDGTQPEGVCGLVNSAWLLDDFTLATGATRVIPGSFRHRQVPDCGLEPHPEQILVTAPAGSVVVFRGDLLHSGTTNRSQAPRRVFHVAFSRREDSMGGYDQRWRIRKATWERILPAARWILDV